MVLWHNTLFSNNSIHLYSSYDIRSYCNMDKLTNIERAVILIACIILVYIVGGHYE